MVRLVPMNESDFQYYLGWAIQEYADDKVKAGSWSSAEALERSKIDYQKFLPGGLNTKDQ